MSAQVLGCGVCTPNTCRQKSIALVAAGGPAHARPAALGLLCVLSASTASASGSTCSTFKIVKSEETEREGGVTLSLATRANPAGAAQARAHIRIQRVSPWEPRVIQWCALPFLNFCSPDRAGSHLTRRGSNPRPLDPKVSGVYPWLGRPGEGLVGEVGIKPPARRMRMRFVPSQPYGRAGRTGLQDFSPR